MIIQLFLFESECAFRHTNLEFTQAKISRLDTEFSLLIAKLSPFTVSNITNVGCSVFIKVYPQTDPLPFAAKAKVIFCVARGTG